MRLHRIDPHPTPFVREASEHVAIVAQIVRMTLDLYERKGFVPPWAGYLAETEGRIVGTCGFAGPPVNGEAEIAYFTFPGNEGRGVGTRLASALMREARRSSPAEVFVAHTLPVDGPSTTILRKLGFVCLGVIQHHEDGPVWKWRENSASAAPPWG